MPMRPGSTTDDYRNALDGEGEFGSLGYDWSDKPHRLVYDLCDEVDRLRTVFRVNMLRLAPSTSHDEITRILDDHSAQ